MASLADIAHAFSAGFAGGAAASGWMAAVIVANAAFDGLDYGRADRHMRRVLLAVAPFAATLLGVAAATALLSGAFAAFAVSVLAALGFLSNIWTLAPRKGPRVKGVRENKKGKRVLAVSLTLMLSFIAATGAILAALGI